MFDQPFAGDEYLARVARVRGEMARLGLDGMLLTSGPNLTYLSGYPSPLRSGSRPFIFVLPLSGAPILIVHTGRELEARGYSWVEDIRTYPCAVAGATGRDHRGVRGCRSGAGAGRMRAGRRAIARSPRWRIFWSCASGSRGSVLWMAAGPSGRRGCASLPPRSPACGGPAPPPPGPIRARFNWRAPA